MEFWADVVPRRDSVREGGTTWELGDRSFNGRERCCLFRALGGCRFEDVAYIDGVDSNQDGRGAVAADLDGDDAPDLVVCNWSQPARVFRNRGGGGRWCRVQLRGTSPGNREAIGATVICGGAGVPTQALPISAGTAFLSQVPAEACFGLAAAEHCTVTVRWPGGRVTEHHDLGPGRWVIDQATGKATKWAARAE